MQDDDWMEITVTLPAATTVVPTFERTYSDALIAVVYNERNESDGKVYTIEIIPANQ
jgi:hypothetical protein